MSTKSSIYSVFRRCKIIMVSWVVAHVVLAPHDVAFLLVDVACFWSFPASASSVVERKNCLFSPYILGNLH